MKRVRKEKNKVSDFNTRVENQTYLTDRILKVAYDINIDNHHDENANSQITFVSNTNNIGIDKNQYNKIMTEMANIIGRLVNQYEFKYQLTFLVFFNNYGEDNELISELEVPTTLSITHNLTQSELDKLIFNGL